uniref:ATP synthase subunit 8 n=1 Tax=Armadillidium album TaxID=96802 RepID=A0A1P8DKJ8_9CRUS|nr:ATP synthase subunit 8 [Armadillidium album]
MSLSALSYEIPQMGPLPWFMLMSLTLGLILVFMCMIYFSSKSLLGMKMIKFPMEMQKWMW